MTDESIVALLTKKKSEIIALLGKHEEGTFAIAEFHQMIPALIFDNGLTIYFTNLEDDEQPLSIELNDKITFKVIKSGLIFGELQKILGGEDISLTWISTEDNKAYELIYCYGNFSVSVISYNENGDASSIILKVSHLNIFI